jgi:transposase-like protein
MSDQAGVSSTSRRYSKAQLEQAVRLVRQIREETGERHGAVQRVARQLGFGVETVRKWVNQADVDSGDRSGTTTQDNAKIRRLEQENRELRRANEILKSGGCRTNARPWPVCRVVQGIVCVVDRQLSAGARSARCRGHPPELEQVVGGGDQLPFAVDGG